MPVRPAPARRLASLALVALLVATSSALTTRATDASFDPAAGLLLRGTVVTMDDAGTVVPDGRVLVRDGRIVAVWSGAQPPTGIDVGAAQLVDVGEDARIYPGLLNLHGHPAYNALPLWLAPSSHVQADKGRPTGLEAYANRYQWNTPDGTTTDYQRLVANPRIVLQATLRQGPELVKHAEAMSVLGGQTLFQGDGISYPQTDHHLVRNVDRNAFCAYEQTCPDLVGSRVADVRTMRPESCRVDFGNQTLRDCPGVGILASMADGSLRTWFVHVAEGVRDGDRRAGDEESSRSEFLHLASVGLLTEETVILHGVALENEDFVAMRLAPSARVGVPGDGLGARLVWAPLSNLLLYGETVHVHDALRAGVLVTLGTDWTPSGSRSLLDEMKVADIALRDPRVLGDERFLVPWHVATAAEEVALDRQIVRMATSSPAKAIRAWDKVGSVEAGKIADLVVITKPAASPTGGMPGSVYRDLIDATERDVRLVLVGGEPVAGDVGVMSALKPGDFEIVESERGGYAKAIDITNATVPDGDQTLAEVEAELARSLAALGEGPEYAWLKANMDGGRHMNESAEAFRASLVARFGTPEGEVNLEAIGLTPLLIEDDELLFAALRVAVDEAGLLDVAGPPYALYRANANHANGGDNPFEAGAFEARWYAG